MNKINFKTLRKKKKEKNQTNYLFQQIKFKQIFNKILQENFSAKKKKKKKNKTKQKKFKYKKNKNYMNLFFIF